MRFRSFVLLPIFVLMAPAYANAHIGAHVGIDTGVAFFEGFVHPLRGADHMLAMIGVGLWAGIKGGNARWLWPLAFVSVMAFGAVLGLQGFGLPHAEAFILASVVGLGAVIGLGLLPPIALGTALCGLFAVAHGHAHGTELPTGVSPTGYMLGFLLATAALHLGGACIGVVAARRAYLVRAAGAILLAGAAYLGLA
jgi:urease accessory protein